MVDFFKKATPSAKGKRSTPTASILFFPLDQVLVPVQVIRSSRRTLALEITPSLELVLRSPFSLSEDILVRYLQDQGPWIRRHWKAMAQRKEEQERQPLPAPFSDVELAHITKEAQAILPGRVHYFAEIMGLSYGRLTLRKQKTRWGSCSAKGNLNLNCLLVLCPPEVRDYVIIHELCHLKEMNHSPRFWQQVATYCPHYKAHRAWLRQQGSELIRRLP